MSSFSKDNKWMEAKKVVGNTNWLEIISYYRAINGTDVFVYSVIDGDKRLIVDVLDNDTVLLLNKSGQLVTEDYEATLNSKKIFKHSEQGERRNFYLGSQKYSIVIESRL